jgi:hypothetical protein
MPKYRVEFQSSASSYVNVESDLDLPVNRYGEVEFDKVENTQGLYDLIDEATEGLDAGLCHGCSSRVELGDDFDAYDQKGNPFYVRRVD